MDKEHEKKSVKTMSNEKLVRLFEVACMWMDTANEGDEYFEACDRMEIIKAEILNRMKKEETK